MRDNMKCYIERTSFEEVKIYWRTVESFWEQVDKLRAKKIISIISDMPDITTSATLNCNSVYYEYYI